MTSRWRTGAPACPVSASRSMRSGSLSLGCVPGIVRDRREVLGRGVEPRDAGPPNRAVPSGVVHVAAEIVRTLDLRRRAGRVHVAQVETPGEVVRRSGLIV